MKATVEGIERGHFLLGALTDDTDPMLFTVTRVMGKHSVMAITHAERMTIEITLNTNGISNPESPWKRVGFTPAEEGQDIRGLIR